MKFKQVRNTWQQNGLIQKVGMLLVLVLAECNLANSQTWIPMTTPPPFNVGVSLQLTDGTILINESKSPNWWKLTPDKFGVYHTGTFKKVASFPVAMNYAPTLYASAVLPDGRVIVEGGEYNNGINTDTNLGAIYDPTAGSLGTWTQVLAPKGWTHIGDAQSVVLPDGTFMIAKISDGEAALLDAKTLTWTIIPGTGKFDHNDEEGWTLLPNDKMLTVDTYDNVNDPTGMNSELFDIPTRTWSSAGDTKVQLWDSRAACGGKSTHEVGPAVLMADGRVFATGADTCGVAGHTALFNTTTRVWTKGPDFPGVNDIADGPAALLPNGHVMVDTNPGYGIDGSTFYAFNGSGFDTIPQPTGLTSSNTEGHRLLVTAAGSVLFTHLGFPEMWFFEPTGSPKAAWRPHITSLPTTVTRGKTYTAKGTQFNGLSQGAMFGDDAQSATNYPLIVIRNDATGHEFFARTHNFSTMGVATGSALVSTQFTVSSATETGASTLEVIANGIASSAVALVVE